MILCSYLCQKINKLINFNLKLIRFVFENNATISLYSWYFSPLQQIFSTIFYLFLFFCVSTFPSDEEVNCMLETAAEQVRGTPIITWEKVFFFFLERSWFFFLSVIKVFNKKKWKKLKPNTLTKNQSQMWKISTTKKNHKSEMLQKFSRVFN